ncbi:phosphatidylinositol 4-kinase alpha 1 [Nymphaea colorata]|nr:phosphatidylinositol 4-kinase alpha 1 [Nymphaea colorata]
MDALTELCDLVSQNPEAFGDKIAWICSRCPTTLSTSGDGGPPTRVTRSQLNAVLAVASFLSKCPAYADHRPRTAVLDFLRSIPASFHEAFWPPGFGADAVEVFFSDLLGRVTKATDVSPALAAEVTSFFGGIVVNSVRFGAETPIARAFLIAVSKTCPPVTESDGDDLVSCLLEGFSPQGSPREVGSMSSPSDYASSVENSGSAASTPSKGKDKEEASEDGAKGSRLNGTSIAGRSSLDQLAVPFGFNDGVAVLKQQMIAFEEETVEGLEKQEMTFRLFGHVLDRVPVRLCHLEQMRTVASKQLKSLPVFLRIRKRDWTDQGSTLKARINGKLAVCQAAGWVLVKSLLSLNSEGKTSKMLLRGTLAVLLDAADACILSSWRKLKTCEQLFSSLLNGVAQVAVARGGQVLRVLLLRLKSLVLSVCTPAPSAGDAKDGTQDAMFDSVTKTCCEIIEFGWNKDKAPVESFILALAASIRERNDYEEQDEKDKQVFSGVQLNVIRFLANLSVSVNKWEVVDMVLPLFIESLQEGDASAPSLLRLRLLDAVSRMASLGFEKSYRETVVLMTRSYLDKLSAVSSPEPLSPEATKEREETLPAGFLLIASGLTNAKLRSDYRKCLLVLCSDVGLAAESKSGKSGGDFLGPILPAVAEICSDFDPTQDVEPSLLKLFRNLWFYIVLFGLAPPIQKNQVQAKPASTLTSLASMSALALQAVAGPYMWNGQWSMAVQRIAQGTPPLVVSSVKWLEDELELNALHNPGSRRGSGNEKAAAAQRAALCAALGGRVEVAAMATISGVKATYLLAVAFLEMIRFSCNGGILNGSSESADSRSAFSCVFEYLETPNLKPAVLQCLTAIVHGAFETVCMWLDERVAAAGGEADRREAVLCAHACFLIKSMTLREEHVRDISVVLLTQMKDRFPQILWNSSCVDSLLFSVDNNVPPSLVNDPASVATIRAVYHRVVREWITNALSYAPCTTQGLLQPFIQEKFCKLNAWQRTLNASDVVTLLSEIRLGSGKSDSWTGIRTANIPAVIAAAAAASGANLNVTEAINLEVLSTGIASANVKCNYTREISGMRNFYSSIGGFGQNMAPSNGFSLDLAFQGLKASFSNEQVQPKNDSFNEILLTKYVGLLQQFVSIAEKGVTLDKASFRETCYRATALLLSSLETDVKLNSEGFSQLLRLLCWCPSYILTTDAMETGVFIWTWLVSAAPQLGSLLLAELVDAWLWTIDTKRGLFAFGMNNAGPAAKLRPQLSPGEPELQPERDPVEGITAHRLWLGFLIDRFEVIRHESVEQLLLLGRMLQGTMKSPSHFSQHPAAVGTFFTAMLLGFKFCSCQTQSNLENCRTGLCLLEDRVYRASLGWFAHEPEWYDTSNKSFAHAEAQSVHLFIHHLMNERVESSPVDQSSKVRNRESGSSFGNMTEQAHPVWGSVENPTIGREKRKQLLLMLCQNEAERLDVWAQPLKDSTSSRSKISSEKWIEYVRTAFSVDPRIALSLAARFPSVSALKNELMQLVQLHILDLRTIPEALPFFVTPKAVDENSALLQQLPHWAPCSITQALEFLTPPFKGHPRVMAYVLRVLESYPPERVTFFMPQLVQALRYDEGKLVEGYLVGAARRSHIFAHILIWHLQGESSFPETGGDSGPVKSTFQALLPIVRQRIIDSFTTEALDLFRREFDFFDKVTSISGVLFPLPKEERRAGIRRELEKIEIEGEDLYLPTAPNKLVRGIQLDSGIPLQSAAKVPIMITFNVIDRDGNPDDIKPQACIFKVGDDCRQDVLALQVIALLRDIFEAVGLNLYLFPYGVLPTGYERGIIEVVPNTRSRNQMGEITDGGLYEIFQQDYGPVGSPTFEAARYNFIISSAGYAVASLLLQPKDRHNGNLLFDNEGRLVHIDFGFILETSPGGNMRFESAHFKLSHEMTQLLDPSGVMKSDTWNQFVSLCVKGYLGARRHMDGIINTVLLMVDSGLPCFSRGDPIGNLRKRFHPEMSEREAANFMIRTCTDAYNKWTTAGYDLIQYLQQGIEK